MYNFFVVVNLRFRLEISKSMDEKSDIIMKVRRFLLFLNCEDYVRVMENNF